MKFVVKLLIKISKLELFQSDQVMDLLMKWALIKI